MESSFDYLSSTREILSPKLKKLPDFWNSSDVETGIKLLTLLAIETIEQEGALTETKKSSCRFFPQKAKPQNTQDRINSFVNRHAFRFIKICESGFPFALLEETTATATLKNALQNSNSVIFHLMNLNKSTWLKEEELNDQYGLTLKLISLREIKKACSNFVEAYKNGRDLRAGYYLLWLIKQITKSNYALPDEDSLNYHTVEETLARVIDKDINSITDPILLVELFCSGENRPYSPLYMKVLNEKQHSHFFFFACEKLRDIPFEKWSNKFEIVKDLLEHKIVDCRLSLAQTLAESLDPKTSELGNHLTAAFQAKSLREAIPHYRSLTEVFSNFDDTYFDNIFARPFIEFRCHSFSQKEPEFVRLLNFTGDEKFFTHDSLMIGICDSHTDCGANPIPPYLMAYNMHSEELSWGIPLVPLPKSTPFLDRDENVREQEQPLFILQKVGSQLTLHWLRQEKVHFISIETGEIINSVTLPFILEEYDDLYIHPSGICYQTLSLEKPMLIGGKIIDGVWERVFETQRPAGFFLPLSTHAGFKLRLEKEFIIFSPTGAEIKLNGFDAKANEDKLYLIEPNPDNKYGCLLTMRTLHNDETVVSEMEKSIPLNVKKAKFITCLDNTKIILLAENERPIFVDLFNNEVVYSQHRVSSRLLGSSIGELWSMEYPDILWKITKTESEKIGPVGTSKSHLLHVDQNGCLYLTFGSF